MKGKLVAAILASLTLVATTSAFAATPEEEIQELKLRIAALEKSLQAVEKSQQSAPKTAPNITITGESRIRYQNDEREDISGISGTKAFDMRQRLHLNAKINEHVSYTARLEGAFKNGDASQGTVRLNRNFFTVTDFGLDKMLIGRVPAFAGKNMNVGKSSDNDGFILMQKAGDVTLTGFVLSVAQNAQFNGIYASTNLGKNADLEIGYTIGDAPAGLPEAKSLDIGAYTKLGRDFSLVGEYVDTNNSGAFADGKAYTVQLVKGVKNTKAGGIAAGMNIVDMSKPHTSGFMIGYRKIEPNALWNKGAASIYNGTSALSGGQANNVKGMWYGFQNVLAKNTILSLEYQDLKKENTSAPGNEDDKCFSAHVQFWF